MKDIYKSERQKNYLNDNYNKLKFEYGLDIELLVNDIELIELLLGKLADRGGLSDEIDDLKSQLAEQDDYRERCREAEVTIDKLEDKIYDLKGLISDLEGEITILKIENNLD